MHHLRATDMLARTGGDEFLLLIENGGNREHCAKGAMKVAAMLREAVAGETYNLNGTTDTITASIGIALFSDAWKDEDGDVDAIRGALLKQADLAMYAAKGAGRNEIYFFNPAMQAEVAKNAEIEADIRVAMAEKQFTLAYQPIVNSERKVVGAEALVRWQHPIKGNIPPDQFIPIAESTGLILPLGEWILREACSQLSLWAKNPALVDLSIAVNVSAKQFSSPQFVSRVMEIIKDTEANSQRLELELTESVMADDTNSLIAKMSELQKVGVGFSLDDFGTGYSSLSFLKRLPLKSLKIDSQFIRDMLTDNSDAEIVRAIITLGITLDLEIIAEGVETQVQADFLKRARCGLMQGYLFGQPGDAQELFRVGMD